MVDDEGETLRGTRSRQGPGVTIAFGAGDDFIGGWGSPSATASSSERGSREDGAMRMIEVFADVACPFTHVGLRRIVERRAAATTSEVLRVKAWPLEWVNGTPLDPALVAEEIAALQVAVAPDLFAGFDPGAFPSTSVPALALAALAAAAGPATGEAVSLALRDALFEQGLDIADTEVLRAIARAHDLDLEAAEEGTVRAEYDEGRARGVVGSPYFIVGDVGFFCPSLDITRVDGRLAIAFDPDALDAMMQRAAASDTRS